MPFNAKLAPQAAGPQCSVLTLLESCPAVSGLRQRTGKGRISKSPGSVLHTDGLWQGWLGQPKHTAWRLLTVDDAFLRALWQAISAVGMYAA